MLHGAAPSELTEESERLANSERCVQVGAKGVARSSSMDVFASQLRARADELRCIGAHPRRDHENTRIASRIDAESTDLMSLHVAATLRIYLASS